MSYELILSNIGNRAKVLNTLNDDNKEKGKITEKLNVPADTKPP